MNIDFIDPRKNAVGFYEVKLVSDYSPNVLIYERQAEPPIKLDPDSKGVYILMNTKKSKRGIIYVYIGFGGVSGKGSLFNRLDALWRNSDRLPPDISDWDKAILIYSWKDDIDVWLERVVNVEKGEVRVKLSEAVMESEVFYLEKFLFHRLKNSPGNLNLRMVGKDKAHFNIPDTDSERYEDYLDMVEELIQQISKYKKIRSLVKLFPRNK